MTRESESSLIAFCIRQRAEFDADAWLQFAHPDRDELAATALFLAGTDWYGHWQDLQAVGLKLAPQDCQQTDRLIQRTNFDCGRFSNILRREIDTHAPVAP